MAKKKKTALDRYNEDSLWDKIREKIFDNPAMKYGVKQPPKGFYSMDEVFHSGPAFEKKMRKRKPVPYFLFVTLPDELEYYLYNRPYRFFTDLRWGIKHYLFDRYDLVKVKGTSCFGYYDPDTRIEGALITILFDFVEKESSVKDITWQYKVDSYGPEKRQTIKNILLAYDYFKKDRPKLIKEEERLLTLVRKYVGKEK